MSLPPSSGIGSRHSSEVENLITRTAKILLVAVIALFYTLVVFNNLTDFGSNYQFVQHVLAMDTTMPGNHGMWRALPYPAAYYTFYWSIIAWEIVTTFLLWWGVAALTRARSKAPVEFNAAKRIPVVALTLSLLMWLLAFHTVGGEWFLMWQSRIWNGQEDSFRNFVEVALVLIFLTRPETEAQP
jgi:predicted small integral membrane protein